jgi:hypothetical protein
MEPAALARYVDEYKPEHAVRESWQDQVTGDGPLRYVYAAYRAFWS